MKKYIIRFLRTTLRLKNDSACVAPSTSLYYTRRLAIDRGPGNIIYRLDPRHIKFDGDGLTLNNVGISYDILKLSAVTRQPSRARLGSIRKIGLYVIGRGRPQVSVIVVYTRYLCDNVH